jgi:hypothetical protein
MKDYLKPTRSRGALIEKCYKVINFALSRNTFTAKDIQDHLQCSKQTAQKHIEAMSLYFELSEDPETGRNGQITYLMIIDWEKKDERKPGNRLKYPFDKLAIGGFELYNKKCISVNALRCAAIRYGVRHDKRFGVYTYSEVYKVVRLR